jgi:hypothetical protein
VPLADGAAFFKACQPVQAFEPRLTAALARRWPDRIPEVLGWDEERAWLLLTDAGTPLMAFGDQLDAWFAVLPLYAELQRAEILHVAEHLAGGVPDRRAMGHPDLFADLLLDELPLTGENLAQLRAFAPRFAELCAASTPLGFPTRSSTTTCMPRTSGRDGQVRICDWGDACVSHPFCTLADTFRLLERSLALDSSNPAFERLRDAYLEPWGNGTPRPIVADALLVGRLRARSGVGCTAPSSRPTDAAAFLLETSCRSCAQILRSSEAGFFMGGKHRENYDDGSCSASSRKPCLSEASSAAQTTAATRWCRSRPRSWRRRPMFDEIVRILRDVLTEAATLMR